MAVRLYMRIAPFLLVPIGLLLVYDAVTFDQCFKACISDGEYAGLRAFGAFTGLLAIGAGGAAARAWRPSARRSELRVSGLIAAGFLAAFAVWFIWASSVGLAQTT